MSTPILIRVGWLSGVSRPGSRALSPEQRALVTALPVATECKLWTNFPYDLLSEGGRARLGESPPEAAGDESSERARDGYAETHLIAASLVNAARFLAASQPLRRPSRVAAWRALKSSCERLLLVTGSCGSQIVRSLERAAPEGAAVELLSFGPVDLPFGAASTGLRQTRLVGDRDWLSGRPDARLRGVGHMDYLRSQAALEAAIRWVRERIDP